jgi:hypothetical protein
LNALNVFRPDIWIEQPHGGIKVHEICPPLHKLLLELM